MNEMVIRSMRSFFHEPLSIQEQLFQPELSVDSKWWIDEKMITKLSL
jgi:hypothetical protein